MRLPFELACYMRVVRILKAEPEPTKSATQYSGRISLGTTVELDYYTMGVKIFVRHGKDGTLKVFTEDSEGRQVVAEWSN